MTLRLKDNLRRMLMSRGIRAADLARQTGIAPSVLSEWMAGRMPRNLSQLRKIAQRLGVSLDDLCFEETEAFLRQDRHPKGPYPLSTTKALCLEEILGLFPITLRLHNGQEVRLAISLDNLHAPAKTEPASSLGPAMEKP